MTPITQLIKEFKTQQATADALGVSVTYIRRWIKADAFISRHTGEVFIKSKTKVRIV